MPKKTHPLINQSALDLSGVDKYLKNILGYSEGVRESLNGKEIYKWIRQGGTDEDSPSVRGIFHFHDPTKTWNSAGLWGSAFSSLNWAQNKTVGLAPTTCYDLVANEIQCPEQPPSSNPDRSWPAARKSFYEALTSSNKLTREQNFSDAFRSLGHVMHLLADAAVPEHTRNDAHPFGSTYEAYVEQSPEAFLTNPGSLVPS